MENRSKYKPKILKFLEENIMLSERFPKHNSKDRLHKKKKIGKLDFNKMKNEALKKRHYLKRLKGHDKHTLGESFLQITHLIKDLYSIHIKKTFKNSKYLKMSKIFEYTLPKEDLLVANKHIKILNVNYH